LKMYTNLLYILGIIVLSYIQISIDHELREEYLSEKGVKNPSATGWRFVALFIPKAYFKKEKIWGGYGLYLFNLVMLAATIFLIAQLLS